MCAADLAGIRLVQCLIMMLFTTVEDNVYMGQSPVNGNNGIFHLSQIKVPIYLNK